MRIILSCENVKGAFVTNGLYSGVAADAANSISRVIISDPTFFMNMVRVDPTVDAQLIKSAQSPEDENIRMHSQTYQTFQMSILANQANFEYVIPFAPTSWSNIETLDPVDYMCALASKATYNGTRVMKTSWFQNNLANYQFFLGCKPTPASSVNVIFCTLRHLQSWLGLCILDTRVQMGITSVCWKTMVLIRNRTLYWDKNLSLSVRKDLSLKVV